MNRPHTNTARRDAFISSALQLVLLVIIWYSVIVNPNAYFFSGGGDGIKNYYTPMYFLKYEDGTHFGGMHYPYGDNVVFSDNQPLISWVLKPLVTCGIFNPDYTIAILNLFMLLSILVCACYLSLLLSHFNVKGMGNVLFAVGIATLSPQVLRFLGHYALAYSCFIPMLWYHLIRHNEAKKIINRYGVALILISLSFSFIHLYYALMTSAFVLLFAVFYPLTKRSFNPAKFIINVIISLLPIICLTIYQLLTESVHDRLAEPFGITAYIAKPETIFVPLEYNLINITQVLGYPIRYNFEGLAFVGITGTLFLLFFIYRTILKLISKDVNLFDSAAIDDSLKASLLAATCILIFSFGVPILWNPDFFLTLTPTLRQFRSLGRFAWIFYYVFNVFAAVSLFHLVLSKFNKQRLLIRLILLVIIGLGWLIDGIQHQVLIRNSVVRNKFTFDFLDGSVYKEKIKSQVPAPDHFQAALVLPFFHVGSEKFYIENNSMYEAFKLSYATGLPLINTCMSRTSVSQTAELVGIVADSLLPKPFFNKLTDPRPILIVTHNGYEHSPEERFLLNHSKEIYQDDGLTMFAMNPDSFKHRSTIDIYFSMNWHKQNALSQFQTSQDSALCMIKYAFNPNNDSLYTLHSKENETFVTLLDTAIHLTDSMIMNMSLWLFIDDIKPAFPYLTVTIQNQQNNEVILDEIHPKNVTSSYNDRLRINYSKNLSAGSYLIQVLIHDKKVIVGNLVLRNIDNHILQSGATINYFDNYPVK